MIGITHRYLLALIVLCPALVAPVAADSEPEPETPAVVEFDPATVSNLVAQLGAEGFRVRRAAEEKLNLGTQAILPILAGFRTSDDPEISERIEEIVSHISKNPAAVPELLVAIKECGNGANREAYGNEWRQALDDWFAKTELGAHHTNSPSATGGQFIQSFVPGCKVINAVTFEMTPIQPGSGWLSLEICPDVNGRPGLPVLARTWLRLNGDEAVPGGSSMVFPVPATTVDPGGTYWMVFQEHREGDGQSGYMVNYQLATDGKGYKNGYLMRNMRYGNRRSSEDVCFRVISGDAAFGFLREPTAVELRGKPKATSSDSWRNGTGRYHQHPEIMWLNQQRILRR